MSKFNNVMEVLKLLEKTNCAECGEKTCMAFAASVFMGKTILERCPYVPKEIYSKYSPQKKKESLFEDDFRLRVSQLLEGLKTINLAERAEIIGGRYENGRVIVKILGKDFGIDKEGGVFTDLHVNPWVLIPVYSYVLNCQGKSVENNWVGMRELEGGLDWDKFFKHQCEMLMKKTADTYPGLFGELVELFQGEKISDGFGASVSVLLYPLPLVPIMVSYWEPEEGMESALNLFFDVSASQNIGAEGLYQLGTGIAQMVAKLAMQHGGALH